MFFGRVAGPRFRDSQPNTIPEGAAALAVLYRAAQVARSLHALHHYQKELRRYQALLEAAQRFDAPTDALIATECIWSELLELAITSSDLQMNVVGHDGDVLGSEAESLGELVMRGVMFVVDAQLYRLREAFRDDPEHATAAVGRVLFADSFRDVEEMSRYIRRAFDAITAGWACFRATPPPCAAPVAVMLAQVDRSTAYRHAIRAAQRNLRALANDPRLAPVLRRGWDLRDSPEVHSAISVIFIILQVRIAIEPYPALLRANGRVTSPASTTDPTRAH